MAAEQGLPSPGIRLADPAALLTHIEVPNQVKDVIMDGPDRNSDAYYTYLDAVDRLNGAVRFIEEELRNGRYLIAKAMENVKADFHGLLADSSLFPDLDELREAMLSEESPDQITPPEMIAEAALPKLHAMARRLVENGCASDCTRAYKEKREAALRRNFQRLGVQTMTKAEIHSTPWPQLEERMRRWSEHMHIGMILVAGEREACDEVFDGLEPCGEQCFVDLSRSSMLLLAGFGEAVSEIKKTPERLFSFLDMYETTLDLKCTVDELFKGPEGEMMRREYQHLLKTLGQAARATFEKFEEAVKAQPTPEDNGPGGAYPALASPTPSERGGGSGFARNESLRGGGILGRLKKMMNKGDDSVSEVGSMTSTSTAAAHSTGDIHPITSYVVNYLLLLCNSELPYFQILECVFEDMISNASDSAASIVTPRVQGRLAFAAARIVDALKTNLGQRAAMLRDDTLAELFMMNNLAYVLTKIDASDAGRLLGTAWIGTYGAMVDTHRDRFIMHTLAKFDVVFSDERLDSSSLVKRLKTFNIILEQMRQRHMAWTITNRELRAHVKAKTLSGLLDKYRDFIIKHGNILRSHRSLDVRVLACEEVETMLADSFSSMPMGKSK
ncbi:hypothetical protein CLOM_g23154 [Closterium sp. NIES-68]|nr:hypothetical protein CLOM_g23154 [Closterium sp. NIES-68]GJP66420.1 hypothetical protein CLOP_g23355 [Closterium sp. NIES-67]